MDINKIVPGTMQPRKTFDPEKLEALAASIVQKGILQPILVRPHGENTYEIIAGERRWRAAQLAGLATVPVHIVDYDDREALEIGLIENLQRDDLNAVEEAESLQRLIRDYDRTQEEVASVIGKSRSYVTNIMRLLSLPTTVQEMIRHGEISQGHARSLINAGNPTKLAQHIMENDLSVRDAEDFIKTTRKRSRKERQPMLREASDIESDIKALEGRLKTIFGLPVKIGIRKYGGDVKVEFKSFQELDDLISKFEKKGTVRITTLI
jgi:ParB family chromosome partitioning protein